jgi:hypothetical protein
MSLVPDRKTADLNSSLIWAVALIVLGFLGFLAFLINADKTAEVRSILVLIGQGFFALVNAFIVYRSTRSTNTKVEHVSERAERINEITEEVRETAKKLDGTVHEIQETVNGNTPPPGTVPKVKS